MITKLNDSYSENLLAQLNSLFNDSLKLSRAKSNLDLEKISSGESNICYQNFVSNIERDGTEKKMIIVNAEINFKFLIVNKNIERYNYIIDNYLFGMERLLNKMENSQYEDETVSYGLSIISISDIKMTGLKSFEGDYFKPSIEYRLMVFDSGIYNNQSIATAV